MALNSSSSCCGVCGLQIEDDGCERQRCTQCGSTRRITEGEVWINDARTKATLSPYICEYGFWLHNSNGSWSGPHTEISIEPQELLDILKTNSGRDRFEVVIERNGLGWIDELKGRPAADYGTLRRVIHNVTLSLQRGSDFTRFVFNGLTGSVDPDSALYESPESIAKLGSYRFELWFKVKDLHIAQHFVTPALVAGMTAYISSTKR